MNNKTLFLIKVVTFLIIVNITILYGDIINVGDGSYTNTLPAGANPPLNQDGEIVYPSITGNIEAPIPTTDWCTSIVYKNDPDNPFSHTLAAHPLMMRCRANGLGVGTNFSSSGSYIFPYNEEFIVGVSGLSATQTLLDDYSDWTVTTEWSDGSNSLKATFGHGLPYIYFTKTGNDAQIVFNNSPSVWYNQDGVLGITVNGHHYGIFAPTGSSWNINGSTYQSGLDGNDYFSVATLPDATTGTLDYYKNHAYAFIVNTEVSWNYDSASSSLISTYDVTTDIKEGTESETMLALYRHQWLNTSNSFSDYSYNSPRGLMKVIEGNSFQTNMTYPGIIPGFTDELSGSAGYDQNQLETYIQELANTSYSQLFPSPDTYFGGKDMGKVAAIVRIAEQIGNTTARDYFINGLKNELEDWLDANSDALFYYNETWGTLIGYPPSFGTDTQLNDHHFHWGYFIMAAATIAQYDISWASESSWGGMINLLIRDVAAWDRSDELFPFLRCYDVYTGHSWAGGSACTGDGNNQESSSEAMNFAAATALWGSVTGNDTIRDLGIYLYTNELHAVEQYWFDIDEETFPDTYDHNCVGMVWSTKADHATWFSGEPEMIHGINFLPITSASLYLGRYPDYVLANYYEMVSENGGTEDNWYEIMWEFLSFADPDLAIYKFNDYPDYPVEGGETRAHTYYWLHSLKSLGEVDKSVTANLPNYAVFLNDDVRTYLAYNPTSSTINVSFSDGESFDIPAGELVSEIRNIGSPTSDDIDFEPAGNGADWTWNVFENDWNPPLEIVSNPDPSGLNTSDTVAKFTALDAGQDWTGCETSDIDPFTFNSQNSSVKIHVYKSVLSDVTIKFEYESSSVEQSVPNTVTDQWQELIFDFSDSMGEFFNKLVVFPDFAPRNQDNIIYFDNVIFSEGLSGENPTSAAPVPPYDSLDVVSIYSDSYTNISDVDYNPDWGQTTIVTTEDFNGNEMMKYANLNYQGTDWNSNPQDVSDYDNLHVDFWTNTSSNLGIYLISGVYPTHTEVKVDFSLNNGNWVSVDIPLGSFAPVDLSDTRQFKIEGDGDVWIDNLYFYIIPPGSDAALNDLLVDGTTIDGFAASTLTYEVELSLGTTVVPTVTATTNDPAATHVVNDATSLPGTTEVVVTAEDGVSTQTYSINFTVADPDPISEYCETEVRHFNNPAEVTSVIYLTITNLDALSMFVEIESADADSVDYLLINGGSGASISGEDFSIPGKISRTLSWVSNPSDSVSLQILWSKVSFGGNWMLDYFAVPFDAICDFESEARLSDLQVDGETVNGFISSILTYDVELSYGTTVVPTVTATTYDPLATHVVNDAASLPGTTTVVVTAQDGITTETYSINFALGNPPGVSEYCETEVWHFNNPAEAASAIYLTVTNLDELSMFVEIESADADSVDYLLITGGSGASISGEDFSVPGKISRTLSWASSPPDSVSMNILWSKVYFSGNWMLGTENIIVPFDVSCNSGTLDAPTNIAISASSTEVTITWDAVTDANSYKIFSSTDPYESSENWTLEEEGISGITWSETILVEKKFYYVVASSDAPGILTGTEQSQQK